MNKENSSNFTVPFIPQQIIIESGDLVQIFESGFEIKGKSNISLPIDSVEQHRIVNQEGLLIIQNNIQTMLIQGVFTRTIPLDQCLQTYLTNYLSNHPLENEHGKQQYITIPNDATIKIISQDHLLPEALTYTAKQFHLEIVQPLQYQTIIKTWIAHNNIE